MRKFLTKEETRKLINLGISVDDASYIEQTNTRYDESTLSTITSFGIWQKKDNIMTMYDTCTGEIIQSKKNYNDDDSVFSIGDLISVVQKRYNKDINEILEEEKWNYLAYERENDSDLLNYLFNYICNHENA